MSCWTAAAERSWSGGEAGAGAAGPQAIWNTPRHHAGWRKPDGRYLPLQQRRRQLGEGGAPRPVEVRYKALTFQVRPMNFKHTGLFPEQA